METVSSPTTKKMPLKLANLENANSIFGPNWANKKGKTTHCKPHMAKAKDCVHMPKGVCTNNLNAVLTAGTVCANGMLFLATCPRQLCSLTAEHMPK